MSLTGFLSRFFAKSQREWGAGVVRTTDTLDMPRADTSLMMLMALARGPVHRCADRNAVVCASFTPRIFRVRGRGRAGEEARAVPTAIRKALAAPGTNRKAAMLADSSADMFEVTGGDLYRIVTAPNQWQTGTEFRYLSHYYKQIVGDFFGYVTDGDAGRSILPLAPHYTNIVVGDSGLPEAVWFGRPGGASRLRIPWDEVVQWRMRPGRVDMFRGEGWLAGVIDDAGLADLAITALKAQWQNGQRPDFVLTLPKDADPRSVEIARQQLEANHRGVTKFGRAMIAIAQDVKPLTWSPKDSGVIQQLDRCDAIIRQAAGIPESLAKLNDANLASSQTGLTQHRRDTILPMLTNDAEQWTTNVLPVLGYDPDAYVVAYTDVVPSDTAAAAARMSMVRFAVTINEVRASQGLDPIRGGDSLPTNELGGVTPPVAEADKHAGIGTAGPWYAQGCCDHGPSAKAMPSAAGLASALAAWFSSAASSFAVTLAGVATLTEAQVAALAALLAGPVNDIFAARAVDQSSAVGLDGFTVMHEQAVAFLDTYRVQLARDIAASLMGDVTAALRAGIESGEGVAGTTQRIRDALPEQADWRALRIARTEMSYITTHADLAVWKAAGIELKVWELSSNPCPVCVAFAATFASGPVPLDTPFCQAGVPIVGADGTTYVTWRAIDGPGLHPNCDCTMTYARKD